MCSFVSEREINRCEHRFLLNNNIMKEHYLAMSQLLAIVLENYVEASSAHYPWKWRLTNHDIHHVLTPWQYFHVSTMSEWLRQVAGWKIRPSLSGQSLVLGCRRRETDPPFPIHGKWAQQLKSDDLLVSRGQSDRVERAAPALRLLPALPSCLLQNVWKAFIYKHLPPSPPAQIHYIQARNKSRCQNSLPMSQVTARENSWK